MAQTKAETSEGLLAKAAAMKQKAKKLKKVEKVDAGKRNTFSHLVMGGIMMMFFVGVGLGVFVTIWRGEAVNTTLNYIMELARIVSLGYFVKAFGENIAKIVLSAVFGSRFTTANSANDNEGGPVG